jgi:hypothetical protein
LTIFLISASSIAFSSCAEICPASRFARASFNGAGRKSEPT